MQFSGKLVIIVAPAVTVLLVSNIIAVKQVYLFTMPFSLIGSDQFVIAASIICFPIGYIISDVLVEVYGFRTARGVIWLGFACNLLMVFLFWVGNILPGPAYWEGEEAYETILGSTGWILVGSFSAYITGEFVNAGVMVILKARTQGRFLWLRTISSTVIGQGVDSLLFFTIAFGVSGFLTWTQAFNLVVTGWLAKSIYEALATPMTYLVVGWLKRTEQMDAYDNPRTLNPFGIFG